MPQKIGKGPKGPTFHTKTPKGTNLPVGRKNPGAGKNTLKRGGK